MHPLHPPYATTGLVPHLKDLFYICLETKAQGFEFLLNDVIVAKSSPISKGLI